MADPFLIADWRYIAVVNYTIDRELLAPFVPAGTVLDTYQGVAYVSLVGLLFENTKVYGISVPFHTHFEEINLRFYVRRLADGEWRRGVVFVKEIVPRYAVAKLARLLYNENYYSLPMRHDLRTPPSNQPTIEYNWQFNDRWLTLRVETKGNAFVPNLGTLEEFIAEHYWGYTPQPDGRSLEYRVEHPRWKVWHTKNVVVDCDALAFYGEPFATALKNSPASAFLAQGSLVKVFKGERLPLA